MKLDRHGYRHGLNRHGYRHTPITIYRHGDPIYIGRRDDDTRNTL